MRLAMGRCQTPPLVTLKECRRFSFMECPAAVRKTLKDFFHSWQQQ
jgi:hypothetical protein